MPNFSSHPIAIIYLIILLCPNLKASAQLFGNTNINNSLDTNANNQVKTDDRINIFTFNANDTSRQKLDTNISFLNRSPIISIWHSDLGNFASSASSVLFQPSLQPNNTFGIRSNQAFLFNWDNTIFYNTTKPYTDLYYRMGTKQEQILKFIHSRNINPLLNFAVAYCKAGSPGSYKLQKTNTDHLQISSNYNSLNQQYRFIAALNYNKTQQDENGGIESEDYLFDVRYNNKRLIPVILDEGGIERNRSSITNYYRDVSFNFDHQYFIGKKDSLFSADSSEKIYSFSPQFGIKHSFTSLFSRYCYKDMSPDSLFYLPIGSLSFYNQDSVFSQADFRQIGNLFSITGDVEFKGNILQSFAGYGFEVDHINQRGRSISFINNYLMARIDKKAIKEKEWLYNAYLKFYFSGNAIGNFLLSAQTGRNFSQPLGEIRFGFESSLQNSSYLNQHFSSTFYDLTSLNQKQNITKLNASYLNNLYQLSVTINYFQMLGYVYRDTTLRSKSYKKAIPLMQAIIEKKLAYHKFHFNNTILLQAVSNQSPIHLPKFASISRLSYEDSIFKHKLAIATGIDMRFNSPFYTDSYSPMMYDFVTQYRQRISNVPRLSYFFNFKVKTFRASISFDEVQQLFTRNNINYSMYPGQNFMLRFGFHWMMVN